MLQSPPEGFERATGVIESRRKCLEPSCGHSFPAVNSKDTECPKCGSNRTAEVAAASK